MRLLLVIALLFGQSHLRREAKPAPVTATVDGQHIFLDWPGRNNERVFAVMRDRRLLNETTWTHYTDSANLVPGEVYVYDVIGVGTVAVEYPWRAAPAAIAASLQRYELADYAGELQSDAIINGEVEAARLAYAALGLAYAVERVPGIGLLDDGASYGPNAFVLENGLWYGLSFNGLLSDMEFPPADLHVITVDGMGTVGLAGTPYLLFSAQHISAGAVIHEIGHSLGAGHGGALSWKKDTDIDALRALIDVNRYGDSECALGGGPVTICAYHQYVMGLRADLVRRDTPGFEAAELFTLPANSAYPKCFWVIERTLAGVEIRLHVDRYAQAATDADTLLLGVFGFGELLALPDGSWTLATTDEGVQVGR